MRVDPTAEEGLVSAPVSSPSVRRLYANVKAGTVGEAHLPCRERLL